MPKTARIAYVTDTHCPDHEPAALRWACGKIEQFKPSHLIFGGDLFEADAASRFYNEKKYDLLAEYEAGSFVLSALAEVAPGAEKVWCLGNHDFNITAPGRIDKRVRSAVHWNQSQWSDHFLRWRQIPYDFSAGGVYQLGQVMAWHGHDGAEDTNAIRINNACGGYSHRLLLGGHTHTPHGPTQVMRTKKIPLPLHYANGGTLGPLRPDWTVRQDTSMWKHAIVFVECTIGRACQPGQNWDCQVEVMG